MVIDAVEEAFDKHKITINKIELLKILSPKTYGRLNTEDLSLCGRELSEKNSFFKILSLLGAYQDRIDKDLKPSGSRYNMANSEESYLERKKSELMNDFKSYEIKIKYKAYFDRVVYPLIFRSIKSDLLTFQRVSKSLKTHPAYQ